LAGLEHPVHKITDNESMCVRTRCRIDERQIPVF